MKLLSKDIVNVTLEMGGYIGKAKKHYLVLKLAVSGAENSLPLITFSNSHRIIGTSEILPGKPLELA